MPELSPKSKAVEAYYATLERYAKVGAQHEQAVKTAFHGILQEAAGALWTLVPEFSPRGQRIRYDGVIRDAYGLTLGYWEAKDSQDNLDKEVQKKIGKGYSLQNTLFQAPDRALLYQDGKLVLDADLTDAKKLVDVINLFLDYREPEIEQFHLAVAGFKERIPELAEGLLRKIDEARREDVDFRAAFDRFVETVRESINPNIALEAVEEMLVQHLLTERIIRTVFKNRDFARKNAIAVEIEKVIDALTKHYMSREDFLGGLDRFYKAIEDAANGITDWSAKQDFLNTVYEQFFQGFSDRIADTHGIVYTPQPLVDFMVRSVDKLLQRHFGQTLADSDVHVLDPFVGTGNFLVRAMEEIPAPKLPAKYADELHANEVMLLPYYVASLNIEHAYLEKTGTYEAFPGIVLVDTFEMVEGKSIGMFAAENTERAQRQRQSPIKVILGNPPYNAHQVNANDANQNRQYPHIDGRIAETYAAASSATLKSKLYDPYVKAFRWASDRIGDVGIVAFVTNDSFLDNLAFDGMRHHLSGEFDELYVIGLGGNVRKNPKLSGTTHNVFGIRVGVAITFLVRIGGKRTIEQGRGSIHYIETGQGWRKEQKYDWLSEAGDLDGLNWRELKPNKRHLWFTDDLNEEWEDFIPLASADEKASGEENETTILDEFCLGISTNRDAWVYDFDRNRLADRVEQFVDTYNAQVARWQRKASESIAPQAVVSFDQTKIKWSEKLFRLVKSFTLLGFEEGIIIRSMYRPFLIKWVYYDSNLIERPSRWSDYFPCVNSENKVICISAKVSGKDFFCLMSDCIVDLHFTGIHGRSRFTSTAKMARVRRTSRTGRWNSFGNGTRTSRSPSGTSSTTSTASCITPPTASATRAT